METADFGFTLWGNELVAFQGNIYIFGGWTGSGVNKIWRFTPQTGTLTELPTTLPHAANQISGMLGTDNLIYLFSGHPIQSIQVFDPADNTISLSSATFDNILQDPVVWRNAENRFYCGDYLADKIYRFIPESQSLEISTLDLGLEVMKSLYFGTAVTLPDGRVFICGGIYDGAALANVWELIPR